MFVCPYCTFKPFNTSYLSGWPLGTTWQPLGDHLVTTWWPISEILTLFVLCLFLVNMQFSPLRYWRSSASLLLTAVKWHQRQLLKIHIQPVRNNPELLVIFLRERAEKSTENVHPACPWPPTPPMFANSMLACAHSQAHLIFPFAFMINPFFVWKLQMFYIFFSALLRNC